MEWYSGTANYGVSSSYAQAPAPAQGFGYASSFEDEPPLLEGEAALNTLLLLLNPNVEGGSNMPEVCCCCHGSLSAHAMSIRMPGCLLTPIGWPMMS